MNQQVGQMPNLFFCALQYPNLLTVSELYGIIDGKYPRIGQASKAQSHLEYSILSVPF